ncbi:MAG TPA: DUF6438 domain-containing protein [Longimicrobiales bacterium]
MHRSPFIAAALAALAACVGNADPEQPAPTASDSISMTRGPCFGACPMYTVTVYGDGRVVFRGDRFVAETGERTKTIGAAEAAALFAAADSIDFHRLPADITPANQDACGASWTDMPSAEVTVRWNARMHTVNHYHGCPKAPERLTQFENRIDAVAGIAPWIVRD